MQLVLDRFGRVVLPKLIRDNLGLRPGDALDLEEREESVVLHPQRLRPAIEEKDGLLVFAGTADESLEKAVEQHRQDRLRRQSGMEG